MSARHSALFGWLRSALRPRPAAATPPAVGVPASQPCPPEHEPPHPDEPMEPMLDTPWELIVRHAAGDLTPGSTAELARWRDASARNARLLDRSVNLVALSRQADADARAERSLHRLRLRIADAEHGATPPRALHLSPERPPAPVPSRERGTRRQHRPVDRPLPIRRGAWLAAAALLLVVLAGTLLQTRGGARAELRTVSARAGERTEVGLPDGSRVVLGALSTLRWAPATWARDRTIWLEGDAYFTVVPDTAHPFVVQAGGSATQAVGTAFGVRARAGEPAVRVVVTEGSVLLRQADATAGTGTVLDRGDLGELDASGRTQVARDVDVQAHLGWLRGRMAYDAAPARTIAHDIERWYGVTVRIEDAVADTTRLTMTMDVRQPATLSLKRLAEVLDLRLVHEGTQARLLPRVPVATH